MPHYVFTADTRDPDQTGDSAPLILGVAMDVTDVEVGRIVEDLIRKTGYDVRATTAVAYKPEPIKDGDVVTGSVAMTLPPGSSIVRRFSADGVGVRPRSALLKAPGGWVTAIDLTNAGGIDERSKYRVLFVGSREVEEFGTGRRR